MRFAIAFGALALLAATPASSMVLGCSSGCLAYDGFLYDVDYTVPPDGKVYRWDLWTSDPDVTAVLTAPNQVETFHFISNGDGTTHVDYSDLATDYIFQSTPAPTGHSYYTVSAPAQFNNCGPATPAGENCADLVHVWGNGGAIYLFNHGQMLSGDDPLVTVFFAQTALPEPQTWALAILGLGAAGAMLRRRRAAPRVA